jgi:hypothetical protein
MPAAASALGGDTPKQLLSIIHDFAYEKSHGSKHPTPPTPRAHATRLFPRLRLIELSVFSLGVSAKRRVFDLRRCLAEARTAADVATAKLDVAKRA